MTGSRPGPPVKRTTSLTMAAAKDLVVEQVKGGATIAAALEKAGRARKSYEEWRRNDPAFKAAIDQARQLQGKREVKRGERIGFAEFRRKYLKSETFWHQLQIVDLLEGREPRDLHPSQVFEQGRKNRVLVNIPPFHAKSTTVTIDYSVYRLCMDPSFRILIVSAGSLLATDFLYGIKQRLTSPDFLELQMAYAPDGGWEATAESWTDSRIIFGTDVRSSGDATAHEKDPNVQAVGMRSKIYGKRADLIILDDSVDGTNVNEYAKQLTWLRREVSSRLEAAGKLLILGTRVAPVDLYSELMKPENYANQKVPWTRLASPAILEEAADPKDHVTLWPYSDQPWLSPSDDLDECLCEDVKCAEGFIIDGKQLWARWDGIHLEKGPRSENNNAEWALVYQQRSVPEDATFPEHKVARATNSLRLCGVLKPNMTGHPLGGMHNKYVIAGLDPSIKGFAGMVAIAIDRDTNKRYLLNAWNIKAPTKDQLVQKMQEVTEHYGVNEWRVEKTGLLQFFTQDSVMLQWFNNRGVRFTGHHTGSNKWDHSFGVSSLASLFGEATRSAQDPNAPWSWITEPLLELPRPNKDGVKALVHQLVTWTPELDPNKIPCDMVMALWFAETGAREHLGYGRGNGTLTAFGRSGKYISSRRYGNTQTVKLSDYRPA